MALAFVPLLGGCAIGGVDEKDLVVYDEVLTRGDIEHIMGIPFIMPSGWRMEITNFRSSQAIDRKIKLPKLPKFSRHKGTILKLFVPSGNEDLFKNIGGTVALMLEGEGKSWGVKAELSSLIFCSANYFYPREFTQIDFPDCPDFVPEYVHIIYTPDKTSIDMPVKIVLRSGGGC